MTIFAQKYILIEQFESNGILAQLGEHLPYKQGVTGSSPVGPTRLSKDNQGSRCGGTGRRAGLKILLWQHSTGSIPVTGMFKFFKALGVPDFSGMSFFVFFYAIEIPLEFLLYKKVPLNRRTCGKGKTVAQ